MSSSTSGSGHPQSRGTLLILLVLVLGLVATLLLMHHRRPVPTVPVSARFPAGKVTAAPDEVPKKGSAPAAQSARPNIVTIVADDMRTDDLRWMPEVRRLVGGSGLTYRNSFSPFPLGSPARASLMSGQYAHNHQVLSATAPHGFGAFDDSATIATSLNAAGYNTIAVGQYLDGYGTQKSKVTGRESFTYVPPGWSDWRAVVSRPRHSGYRSGGTDTYFHTLIDVNGRIDDSHKGRYQTEVLGRMARNAVKYYHRSPKPFFLYLAPLAPHAGSPRESDDPPGQVDPATGDDLSITTPARPHRVWGMFDDRITRASGLPRDGGPSERDVSDKPRPMNALPELTGQQRRADLTLTRQRAEALAVLDNQVQRLVQTLKRTGEWADTVLVFTSSNGYFLGEHRVSQGSIKPHEPSLRVPFLITGPGIPHGQRFDPVTTPDVTATVAQIAGATPPHPADGVSIVPSFTRDRGWTVPVVTEGVETARVFRDAEKDRAPGFTDGRTTIGIRTARYLYVRYDDGDGELYDLLKDPNELQSRWKDPMYASVKRSLAKIWAAYEDCAGAACRAPMATARQADPALEKSMTKTQSRGVEARYGYYR